jgi:hypothetical protein
VSTSVYNGRHRAEWLAKLVEETPVAMKRGSIQANVFAEGLKLFSLCEQKLNGRDISVVRAPLNERGAIGRPRIRGMALLQVVKG